MKTKNILVMMVEAQIGEDDQIRGGRLTTTDPSNPQKRNTRQFESLADALDDVLSHLLHAKLQQIEAQMEVPGIAGNA